ncbi:MAG: acetolactate synthase small subunit [bacterium]|nr:acetolactate synthase small subunit [bacterium]
MSNSKNGVRTVVLLTEDRPGMILDIARVILDQGFTIQSFVAGPCEKGNHARFTFLMKSLREDSSDTNPMIEALKNLYGVERAEDITEQKIVARELAIIKVKAAKEERGRIVDLASIFRADVIEVTGTRLILSLHEIPDEIDRFCVLLKADIEVIKRTGIVAMISGEAPPQHQEPSLEAAV